MIETMKYKLSKIVVKAGIISYAELYNVALTSKDLDLINEDIDFVNQCVTKQL
jgi:hypothetical protein